MNKCNLCSGKLRVTRKNLRGSTSRGTKIYNFHLYECKVCSLIQKNTGKRYKKIMSEIYEFDYQLPGGGRNVNVQNGKVENREKK